MPPVAPTLFVTCSLLAAALGGAAAPAQAMGVRTDGRQARPAAAQRHTGGTPIARIALPRRSHAARGSAPRHPGAAVARAAVPRPATAVVRATARATAAPATGGDPRRVGQWALQGDGPMGIASAWRQTTGGDVVVAIVDSGVDLQHPDLVPNLWTNPGEIPGNGVDDDGNGYVDDVHGYDVVDGDGDPQDRNGHGTHVAGIVAARGGNDIGVTGVAWRARLMAVRVLDAAANGTTADVAAGVRYAVANGARIVNLSLAGSHPSPDLEDAILDAASHGVLVVAAAGNAGQDLARTPAYPAAYAIADVLGVAASREDGRLSSVSDFGAGADLAAPGEDVLSTALGGGYEWRTGTSMAAPQVTGALALLAAARPDLDATGLRDALVASARVGGLPVEAGALDVGAALRRVVPAQAWHAAPAASTGTAPRHAKAAHRSKDRRAQATRAHTARAKAARRSKDRRAKATRAHTASAKAARRRVARKTAR